MDSLRVGLQGVIIRGVTGLELSRVRRTYWQQNECVFLERFLPPELVQHSLVPEVEKLRPNVHRNYIPGFKKGGAVSYQTLAEKAPVFLALYSSPVFDELAEQGYVIVGSPETVAERIRAAQAELGFGILLPLLQFGPLPHDLTKRNMEMFAKEIMPQLRPL